MGAKGLAKQSWPGWYTDAQLASEYAQSLARQLAASVNAGQLATQWLALHGTDPTQPASAMDVAKARRRRRHRHATQQQTQQQQQPAQQPQRPAPRQFLINQGVVSAITAIIAALLMQLWAAAWALGWASAVAVLGVAQIEGSEKALAELLAEGKTRIGWILQTRLSRLERVLMAALRDGTSVDELARQISDILASLTSALLVTQTETSWASQWAAYQAYRLAGVKWVRWLSRRDGRTCKVCLGNDNQGPIPFGQKFLSGLRHPPQHQRCRCVLTVANAPKSTAKSIAEMAA